mmetsp:Transcript_56500/g.183050  ORF Transcript_56500/g.183050 Transcript_56500/m.183050 type:complete len:228 (+) Transcript_56500:1313-1996(+)
MQVLRAISVQVLAVVEEELVDRTSGQWPHQLWRHLVGQKDAPDEDISENPLHKDIQVVALVGETRHERGIVLQSSWRQAVPPICERRRHLAVERATDGSEAQGLPHVEPDNQLLNEGEPWELVPDRGRQVEHCRVEAQKHADHAPMPHQEGIRDAQAAVCIMYPLHANVCNLSEGLALHLSLIWRGEAARLIVVEPIDTERGPHLVPLERHSWNALNERIQPLGGEG